jgi:hypothetical protein
MSTGEEPRAPGQSLQTPVCDALDPPIGGTFLLEISVMPPLPKTCPKMVPSHKGVAFV